MARILGHPISSVGETNVCVLDVEPTTCGSERCDTLAPSYREHLSRMLLARYLTNKPNNLTTPKKNPHRTLRFILTPSYTHLNGQTEKRLRRVRRVIVPQGEYPTIPKLQHLKQTSSTRSRSAPSSIPPPGKPIPHRHQGYKNQMQNSRTT
ncbi:unnamed protein product, partial [Tuber aestivum]